MLLWILVVVFFGAPACAERGSVEVVRVVDGDTVVIRRGRGQETVRLLGVDTPERGRRGRAGEPYSRAAERFTRERLARAERVALEVAGDRIDDHGRTLGFLWLWLPDENGPVNLSEELLQAGLARAMRYFDYPGKGRFVELEGEARRSKRGMWKR